MFLVFFFKQKTAYEMRISDWSSDVCSSDLHDVAGTDKSLLRHQRVLDAALAEVEEVTDSLLLGKAPHVDAQLRPERVRRRREVVDNQHKFIRAEDRKSVV